MNKLVFGIQKKREIDQRRTLSIRILCSTFLFRIPRDNKKITPGRPITEVFFKLHFRVSTISGKSDKSIWAYLFTVATDTKDFHFLNSFTISPRTARHDDLEDGVSKIDPCHLNMRFCGSSLFIHFIFIELAQSLRAVCVCYFLFLPRLCVDTCKP